MIKNINFHNGRIVPDVSLMKSAKLLFWKTHYKRQFYFHENHFILKFLELIYWYLGVKINLGFKTTISILSYIMLKNVI